MTEKEIAAIEEKAIELHKRLCVTAASDGGFSRDNSYYFTEKSLELIHALRSERAALERAVGVIGGCPYQLDLLDEKNEYVDCDGKMVEEIYCEGSQPIEHEWILKCSGDQIECLKRYLRGEK